MVVMPAIDPAVGALLAVALAAIFAWSAAMKFADLDVFEGATANYRLLPRRVVRTVSRAVPLCECSGAAALLLPSTRAIGVVCLMLLLGVFTAAIAINLMRGRTNIDCGCFGPAVRQSLSAWLLGRNALLFVLAALATAPRSTRPLAWIDGVTIGLGATALVLLYASANYALGNAPRTRALEAL